VTAEERFEDLVDQLANLPGVTAPQDGGGFGRNTLRWGKTIFTLALAETTGPASGAAAPSVITGDVIIS
jgi:hypothetical protein